MKRMQIKRYAHLRHRSDKQQARQTKWNAITDRKKAAGLGCELATGSRCRGRVEYGHHHLPTRQGGAWNEANHKGTCVPCHEYAHGHPAESYERRWILRKCDAPPEVRRRKGDGE